MHESPTESADLLIVSLGARCKHLLDAEEGEARDLRRRGGAGSDESNDDGFIGRRANQRASAVVCYARNEASQERRLSAPRWALDEVQAPRPYVHASIKSLPLRSIQYRRWVAVVVVERPAIVIDADKFVVIIVNNGEGALTAFAAACDRSATEEAVAVFAF